MGGLLSSIGLGEDPNLDVPDPATTLTPREKRAVRQSWAMVQPVIKPAGLDLFMLLFQTYPKHHDLFVPFKGKTLDELKKNKLLAAHALGVMHNVSSLVEALDDAECLTELLAKIGRTHNKHKVPKEAFTDLKVVILKLLKSKLGNKLTPQAEAAWDKTLTVSNTIIWKYL